MAKPYVLRGRVHARDEGLHGIVVVLMDDESRFAEELGESITAEDGSFSFEFDPDRNAELFKARPKLRIQLRDVGGKLLHTPDEDYRLRRGGTETIDLEIPRRKVPAENKSLRPSSGSVIPPERSAAVSAAWETLAQSRGDGRSFPTMLAMCPLPPLARFDDIIDVAMEVLRGDPVARADLADRFTTMQARSAPNPEIGARIEQLGKLLDSDEYWKSIQGELQELGDNGPAPGTQLVPKENFLALAAATIMMSGPDPKAIHSNLATLDAQLCDLRPYGPVVNAAEQFELDGGLGHFERAWTDFSDMWGPDDGPPWPGPIPGPVPRPDGPRPWPDPWPPRPGGLPGDPSIVERWLCLAELVRAFRRALIPHACYTITSVSDLRACPGDQITITGSGFRSRAGLVRFRTPVGRPLLVTPDSWSDTSITVTVPERAACGELSLQIVVDTINACDIFIDIYAPACGALPIFSGGHTRAFNVRWSNTYGDGCIRPDSRARLHWSSCNADRVRISVIDDDGTILWSDNSAASSGVRMIDIGGYTTTTTVTATVRATGPCGESIQRAELRVQEPFNLAIAGLEVTQAIQYYQAAQHLTDVNDRGPDNSLQLVSNKAAWVRVYLRSGQIPTFDGGDLPGVTGTLRVERRVGGTWTTVGTLTPTNAPITARDAWANYNAERNNINSSLNFIIPAGWMTGLLRLRSEVSAPDTCGEDTATNTLQVDVNLQQTLQVAAVRVGYQGPNAAGTGNVTFAAPSVAAVTADTAFSLLVFPLGNTPTVRSISNVNAGTPLTGTVPAGGCDPAWTPILNQVANARSNDGNQTGWVYYGFVTPSIPRTHGNVGCASGGNGAGLVGGGGTFAHEVGHQAGLPHAPCGAVGTANPNYPLYEPYDTGVTTVNAGGNTVWSDASIGEYGLNINTGFIFNPNPGLANTGKDLMSYCPNAWVSIFTHNFMANNAFLNPVTLATGAARRAPANVGYQIEDSAMPHILTLLGTVGANGDVDVTGVSRVSANLPTMSGARTEYVAELIDEDGLVAASAPVFTMAMEGSNAGCGCGSDATEPPFAFIAAMIDQCEGAALRIRLGDEVVWERVRPERKPQIAKVSTKVSKAGRLTVSWDYEVKPPRGSEAWLRWSNDGGDTWNGLTVGISGRRAVIDPGALPAGPVQLQVLVHDGFSTVTADSKTVRIAAAPIEVAVLHPTEGEPIPADTPIHLWGAAVGGHVDDKSHVEWLIDGKQAADEVDTWLPPLKPGKHTAQLRIGDATSETVRFVVSEGHPE